MPATDLTITLTVSKHVAQGQPDKQISVSFRIPGNGIIGLGIADPGKIKMGTAIEQMGTLLDEDKSDL